MPKLKKGDIACIRFLDHSEGDDEQDFTVYGRVVRSSKRAYTVACWHYSTGPCSDDNETRYTILKDVILEAKTLHST